MLRLLAVFDWIKPFINCTQLQLKKKEKRTVLSYHCCHQDSECGFKKGTFLYFVLAVTWIPVCFNDLLIRVKTHQATAFALLN